MTRWSTLVAEAGAVTVGVLFAFAIQAWWEERKEAEDRQRIIKVVVRELEQVEQYLNNTITYLDAHQQSLSEGLEAFGTRSDMSDKEIASASAKIGMSLPTPAPSSAVEGLVGSGSFRLIENDVVRSSINQYRQQMAHSHQLQVFLRDIDSKFVSYSLKYANLYAMPGFEWQHPEVEVKMLNIEPDPNKILANREMSNLLWLRVSWTGIYRDSLVKQASLAEKLKRELEEEVE